MNLISDVNILMLKLGRHISSFSRVRPPLYARVARSFAACRPRSPHCSPRTHTHTYLSKRLQEELAFGIEAVRSSLPDMPTVDSILGVVLSNVAPSLPEFLEIYDAPVDLDLESDNVWPMPAPLVF